ncbi:MAG TPA: hypothetical protein VFU11_13180 [Solirubrobacterales bacterium]|nr:hypothetical protein [Solirubrobacterales bacterium]
MYPTSRIVTLLLALALLLPAGAQARSGKLDRSFGEKGKVVRAVDLEADPYTTSKPMIAKLPEGRAVVLAGRTLLAFRADGRRYRIFGDGRVELFPPRGNSILPTDVVADKGGRVIVGSTASSAFEVYPDRLKKEVALARYLPWGTLDRSFGSDGDLLTGLGLPSPWFPPPPAQPYPPPPLAPEVSLEGLALDRQERIVLGGSYLAAIDGWCGGIRRGFVARLLSGGEADPTFGEAGAANLSWSGGGGTPAVTRGGGVYAFHAPGFCKPSPSSLTRLDVNGQRVAEFGAEGVAWIEESAGRPISVAVDAEGRALLLTSDYHWAGVPPTTIVYRVQRNGELDPTFGSGGSVQLGDESLEPTALLVDHRGRILVAGTSFRDRSRNSASSFLVARLTARGQLDRSFGKAGMVETRFGRRAQPAATDMKLTRGGKILVAGTLTSPALPGEQGIAMARYLIR